MAPRRKPRRNKDGRRQQRRKAARKQTKSGRTVSVADVLDQAIALQQKGELAEAAAFYQQILDQIPDHPDALHLLGVIANQRGHFTEATEWITRAIRQKADSPIYYCNLARAFNALEQHASAAEACQRALQIDPRFAPAHLHLGNAFHGAGRLEDAVEAYRRCTLLDPKHAGAYYNMGNALCDADRVQEGIAAYQRALERKPDDVDALYNLANRLREHSAAMEAIPYYRRALALAPRRVDAWNNLALAYRAVNDNDAALDCYRKIVEVDPGNVRAHNDMSELFELAGRLDEARTHVQTARKFAPASYRARVNEARLLARGGARDQALDLVRALLQESAADDEAFFQGEVEYKEHARVSALKLLGALQERRGEYDASFASVVEANRAALALPENRRLQPAAEAVMEQLERLPEQLAGGRMNQWTATGRVDDLPDPVFLVGFPRSGTTLMEQILYAHPRILTMEEKPVLAYILLAAKANADTLPSLDDVDAATLARWRKEYWDGAWQYVDRREGGPTDRTATVVDKMPLYINRLPFIARFFPDAPAVVMLRDPRDAILSCFMQDFNPNPSMFQFLSLERAAAFYARTMRLYQRAREVLPLPFIEVRYEDLLADLEGEVRRVIAGLGLAWDERVLDYRQKIGQRSIATPSSRQVSEPIHQRAVGRWRHYAQHLEPVLPTLAPFVEAFGYDA